MGYNSRFIQTLIDAAPELIEQRIIGELRRDHYRDTFANWLSGGYKGGGTNGEECQELIYQKNPSGEMKLVATRNYGKDEKPLQRYDEMFNDQESGKIKFKSGEHGKDPSHTSPNKKAELLGLINAATGGVYFGKRGYHDYYTGIDETRTRVVLREKAVKHYMEKVKKHGKSIGNNLYTVQIHVSRGPLGIMRPGNYDIDLSMKNGTIGIFFGAIAPAFMATKKALRAAGLGETDENTLYEMHLDMACDLAEVGGPLALGIYPLFTAAGLGKKLLIDGWNFNGKGTRTTQ
ncbi:MAG: hypothetical protein V1648_04865 [Candidatus Aenigmatarchaeota archaeon]